MTDLDKIERDLISYHGNAMRAKIVQTLNAGAKPMARHGALEVTFQNSATPGNMVILVEFHGDRSNDMDDIDKKLRLCMGIGIRQLRNQCCWHNEHGSPAAYWRGVYTVKAPEGLL